MPRLTTAVVLPVTLLAAASLLSGCAGNTIAPSYATTNPNIQVGGQKPVDLAPTLENAGSFCLEITEKWHEDGKTPDGQKLYAKDTARKVVPCAQ
ncbi:MAG: hypothetical protein FJ164_08470 [Gammaproteobacteria bacterium]|nr:hypothetical protein [Gammaproteobacteria bacterium]